jgi:hypothetical protein
MEKRGFLRVSEGPEGRSERPVRWYGQLRLAHPDPQESLMSLEKIVLLVINSLPAGWYAGVE